MKSWPEKQALAEAYDSPDWRQALENRLDQSPLAVLRRLRSNPKELAADLVRQVDGAAVLRGRLEVKGGLNRLESDEVVAEYALSLGNDHPGPSLPEDQQRELDARLEKFDRAIRRHLGRTTE